MRHITYINKNPTTRSITSTNLIVDGNSGITSMSIKTTSPSLSNSSPSATSASIQIKPIYDPSTNVVWVPFNLGDVQSLNAGLGSAPHTALFNHFNSEQGPTGASTPFAYGAQDASIDPSLRQTQTANEVITANAPHEPPIFPISPPASQLKREHPEPSDAQRSSKRLRSSSSFKNIHNQDNVPRLYKPVSKNVWRCMFRHPDEGHACGVISRGRRDLNRHIGVHARAEEGLINEGRLARELAVAIPRQVLMEFVCEDEDCGYLKEYGKPFKYVGHRIDTQKSRHRSEYHY